MYIGKVIYTTFETVQPWDFACCECGATTGIKAVLGPGSQDASDDGKAVMNKGDLIPFFRIKGVRQVYCEACDARHPHGHNLRLPRGL